MDTRAGRVVDDIPPIQESFDMDGEKHEMTVQFGSNEVIMASSNPLPILTKVQLARTKIEKTKPAPEDAAARLAQLDVIERHATKIDTIITNARGNKKAGAAQTTQKKVLSGPLPSLLKATKKYGADFDAKDLDDVFGLYPYPEHGSYAQMRSKAKSESPPDGVGRTAHHAPQAVFAKALSNALADSGEDLIEENPELVQVIRAFLKNLKIMTDNAHSSADQLPTVLLHELTHKDGKGPTPGIHWSDMKKPLMTKLQSIFDEQEMFTDVPSGAILGDLLVVTAKKEVVVKPGEGSYKKFFGKVAEEKGITSGDIVEALSEEFEETVSVLYESEYARSIEAVKIAISQSKVDGPEDGKRNGAVSDFAVYADSKWQEWLQIK